MHKSKFFGSTLIIAGTALGAGMLALPLVSAKAGFFAAIILLLIIWLLMLCTGLLILEVNLAFPAYRNNFGTMAEATLGIFGKIITWLAMLTLLYSLSAAYIAGGASVLTASLQMLFAITTPHWFNAILFTLVLGSAVFWSTKATDIVNRSLLSIKGLLLVATLVLLMPHVDVHKLYGTANGMKLIWLAAPIFLCAFGFHHIIPSLTNYVGHKPKSMQWIIIWGTTIPLLIYIFWLLVTLGVMPSTQIHGSVGKFIHVLVGITQNKWVNTFVNGFSNIAMTTSFLGVTLGLFDFLADTFKRTNTRIGRSQTALLTFVPPLLFALLYPQGFVIALGFAAIFVAILEVILPALMAYRLRKSTTLTSPYRLCGGTISLLIIFLVGMLLIGVQIYG